MRYSNRHKLYRLKLVDIRSLGTFYRNLRKYVRRYLQEYLKSYLRKSPYKGYKSSKILRKQVFMKLSNQKKDIDIITKLKR